MKDRFVILKYGKEYFIKDRLFNKVGWNCHTKFAAELRKTLIEGSKIITKLLW